MSQSYLKYDIYFIQYSSKYYHRIQQLFQALSQTYVTFHHLQYSEDFEKQITTYYKNLKINKRRIIFAVLTGDNPEAYTHPNEGKKIVFNQFKEKETDETIQINQQTDWQELKIEVIKRLQLDFVWVGLLYRIGTNIHDFEEYMKEKQHFQANQIQIIHYFLESIDTQIKNSHFEEVQQKKSQIILQFCQKAKKNLNHYLPHFNQTIEELIRSKFNTRLILVSLTYQDYFYLLLSRSYFNLIYIEQQIFKRFNYFKQTIQQKYPNISRILTFQIFVSLDDYIYSQFIFQCLKYVKKYINRIIKDEPYSVIIKKNHKDIIRQFRPSFQEYFLSICLVLKERAACLKEAVGAIIVKNKKIISTGYNGTPVGTVNCYNGGCLICNNSQKMSTQVLRCTCIHAQYGCIVNAGIEQTPGSVLYSTKLPCLWCAKLIIQGQITEVIYIKSKYISLEYDNIELVKKTFQQGKVKLTEMQLPHS